MGQSLFGQQQLSYHPPYLEKNCHYCHDQPGGNVKSYLSLVCIKCHQEATEQMVMSTRHSPFKFGQCSACHLPHVSTNNSLLKQPKSEICYGCHPDIKPENFLFPHQENPCMLCHQPHASTISKLLLGDPVVLCGEPCHSVAEHGRSNPYGFDVIDPNTNSILTCTSSCHKPHGSDFKNQLAINPRDLCFKCHKL